MDLISKTGVPTKYPGDGLTAAEINAINSTVNLTVDAANSYLKNTLNANEEANDMTRLMTLTEAITTVPISRRTLGLELRFNSSAVGTWVQYSYIGEDTNSSSWNNVNNWSLGTLIDGGEW